MRIYTVEFTEYNEDEPYEVDGIESVWLDEDKAEARFDELEEDQWTEYRLHSYAVEDG